MRHGATRLARCARRLGLDRNPLRRRADRIEAVVLLSTAIVLLAAAPLAAVTAGLQAGHLALRHARAEQAAVRQVTAVLLQPAPPTGAPDPYSAVQLTTVLGRWQPPGQPPRSGQVPAPAGTKAGSRVAIWIDASGAVRDPPPDHRAAVGVACIAAAGTWLVTSVLVLGFSTLARRALDRRRLRDWDAEWRRAASSWTR